MTNPVLENIRRSLGRTQETPLSPPPAIYAPRQAGSTEDEIRLFLDELEKLSAVGQRLTFGDIDAALKDLVAGHEVRKATLWQTPLLEQLALGEALRSLGVELVPPYADKRALAQCDLGVTEADYLLPETGTLVLRASDAKPRAVSLLPRLHLAIVQPEKLRPDMHQVFAEAKDSRYLLFITGPSRTSDIELTTTLGVHGPQELFVWVLEE